MFVPLIVTLLRLCTDSSHSGISWSRAAVKMATRTQTNLLPTELSGTTGEAKTAAPPSTDAPRRVEEHDSAFPVVFVYRILPSLRSEFYCTYSQSEDQGSHYQGPRSLGFE